jgi:type 1 glutamine amidotransferase
MGKRLFLVLALLLASMVPSFSGADSVRKLKVLIVTGGHGFEKEPFFALFQENPEINFTAVTQGKTAGAFDRDDLLGYDVVVLYDMIQEITDAQKAKFLSLLKKGVGLFVMHHALCSYQNWPEYERIVGGKYLMNEEKGADGIATKSDYQHDVEIPVKVIGGNHPVTAGLKDFVIHDEIYIGFRVRPDVTPLLTTSDPRSGKPLAWTRTQGKSRVGFLQLGHDHSAFQNENYRLLVARFIRWTSAR